MMDGSQLEPVDRCEVGLVESGIGGVGGGVGPVTLMGQGAELEQGRGPGRLFRSPGPPAAQD